MFMRISRAIGKSPFRSGDVCLANNQSQVAQPTGCPTAILQEETPNEGRLLCLMQKIIE